MVLQRHDLLFFNTNMFCFVRNCLCTLLVANPKNCLDKSKEKCGTLYVFLRARSR